MASEPFRFGTKGAIRGRVKRLFEERLSAAAYSILKMRSECSVRVAGA